MSVIVGKAGTGRGRPFPALTFLLCAPLTFGLAGCYPRAASSPAPSAAVAPTRDERLRRAQELLSPGEIAAALPQLQIPCDERPDSDCTLRLAAALNDAGEPELAEARLKKYLSGGGDGRAAIVRDLMRLRTKLGDFRGAADAAQRLTTPPYVLGNEFLDVVRALILAGETGRAEKLLEGRADGAEVLTLRGLLEWARDRPEMAKERFALAAERDPQDAFNLYLLGVACQKTGDRTRAESAFAASTQLPDAPTEATLELARLRAGNGKSDEAMVLLNRLPPDERSDPLYWQAVTAAESRRGNPVAIALAQGYGLYHGGDPRQAEAKWQSALPNANGEDLRELFAALHNSAYKRQDAEAALHWADEGIRVFPDDAYLHKRRTEVLLGQNRLDEAQREASAVNRLAAKAASGKGGKVSAEDAADLMCRVTLDAGKQELFLESVSKYEQTNPGAPYPFLFRAEWEGQRGRTPENLQKTLGFYQQAAAKDPKDPDTQAQIGLLLADLNRPKEAETALLRALTRWPRVMDGTPHARLVQIYQRDHRAAEAAYHAAQYRRLRQLKDGWPTLLKALRQNRPVADWLALGDAALLRRENWVALCAFRRATQLAPDNPAAWRGLAAVCKRKGWFLPAFEATLKAKGKDE